MRYGIGRVAMNVFGWDLPGSGKTRSSVLLYPLLIVEGFMSCLFYFCLFVYNGIQMTSNMIGVLLEALTAYSSR